MVGRFESSIENSTCPDSRFSAHLAKTILKVLQETGLEARRFDYVDAPNAVLSARMKGFSNTYGQYKVPDFGVSMHRCGL